MSEAAPAPLSLKISTPLELRAFAQAAVARFGDLIAGTPNTGPSHRGLVLETASHRPVRADVVEPPGAGPHPVMVFIHGGGWVMGDLDTHHQLVLRFAEQGFVVVAMDYGLAPEEAFPAGYDDAVAAIRWTLDNIARYGGDPDRLVVAGDSAGANIAAGVAVSEPDLPIRAVALAYGVFDFENMPTSPQVHTDDFLANLHQAYLGPTGLDRLRDPRVSPIHAAGRLPPTILVVGADDPLVTESAALAQALAASGVPHRLVVLEGYSHAFLHMEKLPETLPAFAAMATFLHQHADARTAGIRPPPTAFDGEAL